jgi:hypothetical protein
MKKLLILILICALTIVLCACGIKTETYPDGQQKCLSGEFTAIKKVDGGGLIDNTCYYIYDNNTKIVYLYTASDYHATMCPYYIIENSEHAIAVYGVNYYVEN